MDEKIKVTGNQPSTSQQGNQLYCVLLLCGKLLLLCAARHQITVAHDGKKLHFKQIHQLLFCCTFDEVALN